MGPPVLFFLSTKYHTFFWLAEINVFWKRSSQEDREETEDASEAQVEAASWVIMVAGLKNPETDAESGADVLFLF